MRAINRELFNWKIASHMLWHTWNTIFPQAKRCKSKVSAKQSGDKGIVHINTQIGYNGLEHYVATSIAAKQNRNLTHVLAPALGWCPLDKFTAIKMSYESPHNAHNHYHNNNNLAGNRRPGCDRRKYVERDDFFAWPRTQWFREEMTYGSWNFLRLLNLKSVWRCELPFSHISDPQSCVHSGCQRAWTWFSRKSHKYLPLIDFNGRPHGTSQILSGLRIFHPSWGRSCRFFT